MACTRRSRTISAAPLAIWEVVEDPHHFPRWWPGVARMEGVHDDRFTQVFTTKKGRPVRIDFTLLESRPPGEDGAGVRRWEQEIVGTPFERVLTASIIELRVEPAGTGTTITLEHEQKLRGYSRTGGFMLKRATGAKLDEALDGLERLTGA
jgi:uncharacterized protein YndB with AHSA1/START domain